MGVATRCFVYNATVLVNLTCVKHQNYVTLSENTETIIIQSNILISSRWALVILHITATEECIAPWKAFLLQKLPVAICHECASLYGTRKCITVTRLYPESGEIFDILRICVFEIHFNIILPPTVTLSNGLSYQVQLLKFRKYLLYLVSYKPRLSHLVRVHHPNSSGWKAWIMKRRLYFSRHFCYFLHLIVDPNILHALFSIILNQRSSLTLRDQVSHTKRIDKFVVMYTFLGSR
jgi:hypothetical protein